ncbi:hypothetical protein I4U23_012747 [Adineta vaga]|nr:hypothetical protein I4U23_012747 [Adineta vaga]
MICSESIEFLTILSVFTLFLFSPIITIILFIGLSWFWSLSMTLFLLLLYASWMYFDRNIDSQGGRWSERLRRSPICTNFTNYFPLKLIKTEDLDSNRNYIFGFHPHGSFSFGALGNFGTEATGFSTLFPSIRPHLMLLHLQFLFPFTREILLRLGACCVSKESCEYFLNGNQGKGHALVIVIGGAREMYLTENDTMKLYLKKRKGFVTLALKHGASLVPVISFGENELYQRTNCFNLIPNGIVWGRFLFGHIPLRRPVFTVVGKPIHVNQNVNPSIEDIDQLHHEYIQAVDEASIVSVISFGKNELYKRRTCFNMISNGTPCVGKPIHVNQNVNPTSDDIDQLHHQSMQEIEQLYEDNKNTYALEYVNLEII